MSASASARLVLAGILAVAAPAAAPAQSPVRAGVVATQALSFVPSSVDAAPAPGAFVFARGEGPPELEIRDAGGEGPARTLPLGFPPLAHRLDPGSSDWLSAGLVEGASVLARVDLSTGAASSLRLDLALAAPRLARGRDGTILLADGVSHAVYRIPPDAWPASASGETPPVAAYRPAPSFTYENRGGIEAIDVAGDVAIDVAGGAGGDGAGKDGAGKDAVGKAGGRTAGGGRTTGGGETIFVSDVGHTRISALRPDGRTTDTITGYAVRKIDVDGLPLAMLLRRAPSGRGDNPSLLIANYQTETLTIADFQPDLQSFAVAAVASISVPREGSASLEAGAVEGAKASPLILASDERQAMIAVGSRLSRRVLFFSRGAATLEKLGDVDLAAPPVDLAVSADGRTVAAIHAGRPLVTTVRFGEAAPAGAAPPARPRPQGAARSFRRAAAGVVAQAGAANVRDLQRRLVELGFSVGAVDGFLGPQTEQALKTLNADRGLALESRDVDAALDALRGVEPRR